MGTGTTQDRTDNSRRAGDPPVGIENSDPLSCVLLGATHSSSLTPGRTVAGCRREKDL